jgi:hypothetical protein
MEIPPSQSKSKTGKKYLLVYIVIVLMIVAGFFVGTRTVFTRRAKANEYSSALSAELRADTLGYNNSIHNITILIPLLDSFYVNVRQPAKYKNVLLGKWNAPINERAVAYMPRLITVKKFENLHNLALLNKTHLAQKIITYLTLIDGSYKKDISSASLAANYIFGMEDALCNETNFNIAINKNFKLDIASDSTKYGTEYDMPFVVKDPVKLDKLATGAINYKARLREYLADINQAKKQAADLLKLIKEEYD